MKMFNVFESCWIGGIYLVYLKNQTIRPVSSVYVTYQKDVNQTQFNFSFLTILFWYLKKMNSHGF